MTKKIAKIYVLLVVLIVIVLLPDQTVSGQTQPGHGWGYGAYTWGKNVSEEALDIAVTADGHSFITGYFQFLNLICIPVSRLSVF